MFFAMFEVVILLSMCNFVMCNENELVEAVRTGNTNRVADMVKDLDDDGGKLKKFLPYLLHEALLSKKEIVANFLADKGADLNVTVNGRQPLRVAIDENLKSCVKFLLNRGADPDALDSSGLSALHHVATKSNDAIVHTLISLGANPNVTDVTGATPLHLALKYGVKSVIKALVNGGTDLTLADEQMDRPLHIAARMWCTEVLHWMLDRGAAVNDTNNYGNTPLQIAVIATNSRVVAALVNAGANVDVGDTNMWLPTAIQEGKGMLEKTLVDMLLAKGSRKDAPDNSVYTPLHLAAIVGDLRSVRILIENGADFASSLDPKILLKRFWADIHAKTEKNFTDFDNLLLCITEAHVSHRNTENADLFQLIRIYLEGGVFALYRLLKVIHFKLKLKRPSRLEDRKFSIFDASLRHVIRGTWLDTLPIEITEDAFYIAGSFAWKLERFSWASSLAINKIPTSYDLSEMLHQFIL